MDEMIVRPTEGMQIGYTYRGSIGIMEIKSTSRRGLVFYDHFDGNERYESPVIFRWSTWEVHIGANSSPYGGTVDVTGILNIEPNWEA